MVTTTIAQLGRETWRQNLLADFPYPWSGDAAKAPGGVLHSLLGSMAVNLAELNDQAVYAFDATRIDTATDVALDNVSRDFYGDQLPRLPGEADDNFRIRIKAGFFIPYTTRQAFITAITRLVGTPPRLITPWIPGETAAYDHAYYDVDVSGAPGLSGDPSLAYQAGIIVILPPTNLQTFGIQWGYDMGAALDSYISAYSPAKSDEFFQDTQVDDLIKRIKAAGITIWRKYLVNKPIDFLIATAFGVAPGTIQSQQVTLPVKTPYWVVVSGNWNATYYVPDTRANQYTVAANTPAPANGRFNVLIVPFTVPNSGIFYLSPGSLTMPVPTPSANPGARLAVSPTWDTGIYIDSIVGSTINLRFTTPSPDGAYVGYVFLPDSQSGVELPPVGATEINEVVPNVIGAPFALASWDTQIAVSMSGGNLRAQFSTAAPAGGFVHWGWFQSS